MIKSEWQAKLADFVPLYEAGTYTANEFSWFALPLFDGESGDKELWDALPKDVRDCFIMQLKNGAVTSDSAGRALAEKLAVIRRVALR